MDNDALNLYHAERALRAVRSIRGEYGRLIIEHPFLIGADTVLDLIDAALKIEDDDGQT